MTLKWTNPNDADYSTAIIRRAAGTIPPASSTDGKASGTVDAARHSSKVANLIANTPYSFAVFAKDTSGNVAAGATLTVATAKDATAPGKVTGLTATATPSSVVLTWTPPKNADYAAAVVRRAKGKTAPSTVKAGTAVGMIAKPGTTITDTKVRPTTTYSYAVFARDTSGNTSAPAKLTVKTPAEPSPVTGVTAAPGETSVVLSWTDPSDSSFAQAMVRRAVGATPPASPTDGTLVGTVAAPGASLTDSGLSAGTQYSYAVFGQNAAGASSIAATATTTTQPASDTLGAGQSLGPGEYLLSNDGSYHADMQSDGNFVVYPAGDNSSTGGATWSAETGGNPGDYVTLQTDGNLVIYPAGDNSSTGGALWNAGTEPSSNDTLKMQNDGNLVVYSEGGLALWSSDSGRLNDTQGSLAPGDTLNAGQSLWSPGNAYHADMQSDGNFVVYPAGDNSSTGGATWSAETGGNPGDYVTLQTDGNLVIYPAGDNSSTGGALWNAGTEPSSNDTLKMQDDGNLVVYSEGGLALWSSDSGRLNDTQGSLAPGDTLNAGQSLWSPGNAYHADMQSDGNFVVYPAGDNSSTGGATWSAETGGNPGDYVTLQTDGNLVIYPAGDNSSTGGALWNAGTEPSSNDTLKMQDDGNLVVYSGTGQALWSSEGGTVTGGNYTAYPWANATTVDQADYDWGYASCPSNDTGCFRLSYEGYGLADPWAYNLRNCTSYVAWYLATQEDISASAVEGLGNAYQWEPTAAKRGVATGTARIGAVAWWGTEVGGGYGHVAIVTGVNSNGTVNVAEYNEAGTGNYSTQGNISPDGYIDF